MYINTFIIIFNYEKKSSYKNSILSDSLISILFKAFKLYFRFSGMKANVKLTSAADTL